MNLQKCPVGVETFDDIRRFNYIYIDKTRGIHNLVSEGKYYFLSRPRRFGKSLLLSTIRSLFEGKKELFKGLYIYDSSFDWEPRPVFLLNFVNADVSSEQGLLSLLEAHLNRWEKEYGVEFEGAALSQRFYGVIERAYQKTGKQVVVLIDEYDKALVSTMGSDSLHKRFRDILKPIFGTIKAADKYIRFGMLTGVTRFSRLSIFSDINNLRDITLDQKYSDLCGITESEIRANCQGHVKRLSHRFQTDSETMIDMLKKNYDGYHFSYQCQDIFNPYSLFCALEEQDLKPYWFSTGTPDFLLKSLRNSDVFLPDVLNSEVDETEISDIDSYGSSTIALLFQTGYLTIKSYDTEYGSYILGIPNSEVSGGLFKNLLPIYMNDRDAKSLGIVRSLTRDLNSGNVEQFLKRLKSFLADIPYYLSKNKPEIYFENNIYIILKLLGVSVETEYHTSQGRIDLLIKTKNYIYVIELKLNGTPEQALQQIEKNGYLEPFATDSRQIFKIGISFSKKSRNIDRWLIS